MCHLEPTENPERSPLSTVADNILLKASITTTNNKGDKGSPCRSPRELLKYLKGDPLMIMEKWTV